VVRRERLSHAYLFTGPPGIGKRLFAEELGKALLCEAPSRTRLEACDRCAACTQVAAATHPDYFVAGRPEDSLEVPIEVIRELCRSFGLKSARGRGKVAILDDADDLNAAAANCFLKTLEEPPPRSVLLLIGSSADRQLPTIVSRCQVVRFAPLANSQVKRILRTQGVEGPAQVERLARLGEGSPGQALALADPDLWEFRRKLISALVTLPAPTSRQREAPSASGFDSVALAQAWGRFVEEAGKEAASQRRRAALVLRLLIGFLHSALTQSVGGVPDVPEEEDMQALRELVKRVDSDCLLALLERCLEGDAQIDRRVQLVLVVEALVDALGQKL
jgi:DNA polymerase-3 subunit delta'